jgi:hypothetical protein
MSALPPEMGIDANPIVGSFGCCAGAACGHAAAPPSNVMNSRRFTRSPRRRGRAAWAAIRVSQAMSPEVKVELPRLVPCGVTSNEVTRDNKVVRCAKDTVAQWNVRYGQARK